MTLVPARFLPLLACALACVLVAGCDRRASDQRPPEAGDRAVAEVGGQTIWASDVKREAIAQGMIGEGEPLDVSSPLFERVLGDVVDQKLLAAEALKRGLDDSPAAQRRMAAARERILGDLLVESMIEKAVNENAIQGLYQEQLKLSRRSEEFNARQIITATQAEAEEVKKLAMQKDAAFDALASARSIDPATRFDGGDLGYFTADVMPESYGAALANAKAGDVVGPFQTEAGWVVLKLIDRRPEPPISIDEARPQIVRFLTYDEVRELLENVRKGAKIKMLVQTPRDVPGAPREPASAPPAPAPGAAPAPAPVPVPPLRGAQPTPSAKP